MIPAAKTLPTNRLGPNVMPLASLFLLVEDAAPDEPEAGFAEVAAAMTLEHVLAAAGLTTAATPPKSQAEAALFWPL